MLPRLQLLLRGVLHAWRGYAISLAAVAVLSIAILPMRGSLGVINILPVFVALSLGLGLLVGAGPASFGAIVAFVAFDYFFLVPYYTLDVANQDHAFALVVYLAISIVTSVLVARVRALTQEAQRESRRTTLLYDLNRSLVRGVTLDQILQTIVENVVGIYGAAACRVLVPNDEGFRSQESASAIGSPVNDIVDRQTAFMAQWVIDHREPAGLSSAGR